ncbi:MAG: beta-lactamase domain protein [Gemmatimonadetes bacterium]|nr:beta-lactamase domain protein [Gemmatimonadota bacterium]
MPMPRTLLAPNPSPMTLDGTRTFIVGRRRPVVIDPGPDDAAHLDAIERALDGVAPVAILLTHAHPDHAEAAPALRHRTGAPVWMARGALSMQSADPGRSAGGSASTESGEAGTLDQPAVGASTKHTGPGELVVDRWLADGDSVDTDAGSVDAVATPGHAPEHLAFHWRGPEAGDGGVLFAGDLFMGVGDTTLVAPPEGNLRAYLASLDRVAVIGPRTLLPAHGPEIADPAAAVERYRAHRRVRIDQAAAALSARRTARPDELLRDVYGDALHPALHAAAAGSLAAILRYLAETGAAEPGSGGTYTFIHRP